MSKTRRALIVPDLHVPYHDPVALGLVEDFARVEGPWDLLIQLGDFCDFPQLARQNKTNLRAQGRRTLEEDYDEGNHILDRWQKFGKKLHILQGNHDHRVERWIDENPLHVTRGMTVQSGLQLRERGISWHPVWENASKAALRIGKAEFIHGISVARNHAEITGRRWGDNIFYGHTHDAECRSFERRGRLTYVAQSFGWLGSDKAIEYQRGRPNKHEHAFGEFVFFPDGYFQYWVHRIFKGRLVGRNGRVYRRGGRK